LGKHWSRVLRKSSGKEKKRRFGERALGKRRKGNPLARNPAPGRRGIDRPSGRLSLSKKKEQLCASHTQGKGGTDKCLQEAKRDDTWRER